MAEISKRKILIVDDQEVLRGLLVKFIHKAGLESIEAENGEKAIELYQTVHPAVVLSDIRMPRMDGLTLLNKIKKIDKSAAVILMTGYGNEEILLKALRGGAINYFKKPFNFHEIIEVIKTLIKHQTEIDLSQIYSPHLVKETKHFVFKTEDADIFPIINQITLHLQKIASPSEILNLKIGIEEMLKNAVEHGNLCIKAEEKSEALKAGRFGELIEKQLKDSNNASKKIYVTAEVTPTQLSVKIKDEGAGFNWQALPELQAESLLHYSGRGIFLTRIYFDEVLYNEKGSEVIMIKVRNRQGIGETG